MNNEVYTMVPKLYTIAKDGHTKVNRRRVFKLHISAEAYTMDHEGYTMDYEGYTMDYDDGAMAIRCLKYVLPVLNFFMIRTEFRQHIVSVQVCHAWREIDLFV